MQNTIQKAISYFTPFERGLWFSSVCIIAACFLLGGQFDALYCFTTILGVSALVFLAKGNVLGQVLIVLFSLLYGYISFRFAYYGEMVTYLGMTAPMALLAAIEWYRHPAAKGKAEVLIIPLTKVKLLRLGLATVGVTVLFYCILGFFGTAYLPLSTLSVTTSFFAMGITYYRSPWYAIAYACNDLVLIALWLLSSMQDPAYFTMALCFALFFINDLYGFYNWNKMKAAQAKARAAAQKEG
ncbi:MAG: nicotinamide riboside transporter PnuC [Faecalibacterium sp.]